MRLRTNPKKTEKALDMPSPAPGTPPKLQPQVKATRRNSSGPSAATPVAKIDGKPTAKASLVAEIAKDSPPTSTPIATKGKEKPQTPSTLAKESSSTTKSEKAPTPLEVADSEKRKTRRVEDSQPAKEARDVKPVLPVAIKGFGVEIAAKRFMEMIEKPVAEQVEKSSKTDEGNNEKSNTVTAVKPSTRSRLSKVGASAVSERKTQSPNPSAMHTKMEDVAKLIVRDSTKKEGVDKISARRSETEQDKTQSKAGAKKSERVSAQVKRKAAEPEELLQTPGKRIRLSRIKSRETKDVDSGTETNDDKYFERFYAKVKTLCAVSEKWSFGGVQWDPSKSMKVFAVSEVDLSSNGNMRLRRSIQIFENMTVRIVVEGSEMTSHYLPAEKVESANDVSQLIHKVATSKICSGIKNFGTTDKVYFPHCVRRGESYFAPECPIIVDAGVVGPLCPHCSRLRNMIQRRNVKETTLLHSKFSRTAVKNVRSGFGKQLYSMLTDMVESSSIEARKERKKLKRMVPAREYPFGDKSMVTSEGMVVDENMIHVGQHQYLKSDASGNITISSVPGTSNGSDYIRLSKSFNSNNGQSDMMTINVVPGQRGSYKVSREGGNNNSTTISGGNLLTPSEMQMVEQLVLQEGGDVGNVIIQNSGDFTLAEGQEYELIGEADSSNPIQVLEVLKEENEENNTIEIIEVDDQTLAQLTAQNMGNFIIQEPNSGFEVQEIDANDPNFRHLVKALNPGGTVVYQS